MSKNRDGRVCIPVLDYAGLTLYRANAHKVKRMLEGHQAEYTADGRCLRLLGCRPALEHPGRTRTARLDPLLAACGRGQVYTKGERQRTTGFKTIHAEDQSVFNAATLDNMSKAPRVYYIDACVSGDVAKRLAKFAARHGLLVVAPASAA